MPATSNTNQLLASLSANTGASATRGRAGTTQDGLFQASLDRQISQFRPETNASAKQPSPAPAETVRKATQVSDSQAAKPVEQPSERPEAQQSAGLDEAAKATARSEANRTRPASERKDAAADKTQDAGSDEEQSMASAAQATAILQLQAVLNPVAEAAPEVAADTAALEAVTNSGDDDASALAKLAAELNGKDGLARQSLPGVAAKVEAAAAAEPDIAIAAKEPGVLLAGKDGAAAVTEDFSSVLEQRIGVQASGVTAQQLGAQAIRVEPARAQSLESGRAQMSIFQPVGGEGWDKALGTRMVMMVSNQQQEVEMQLNPPHLGPMEIKLTLDKDQASVTFVALHAPVREALQASMPKLSEMLAESGIQLADAQVQSQAQRDQAGNEQAGRRQGAQGMVRESLEVQPTPINLLRSPGSLLAPGSVSLFV